MAMNNTPVTAYKLMRRLQDGSLRSLFINRAVDRPLGKWLQAEFHPTPGYQDRFGWHCTPFPFAPHLSLKDRVWVQVELEGEIEINNRPECQGGQWLLCKGRMKIIKILSPDEVEIKRRQFR